MPALEAIFSANAEPFRRELRAAQALSVQAGRNIQQNLSGGGSHLTGGSGRGGVIGEMFVILRELSRGNYARVPGSLTILIQRMGLLKILLKDNALAEEILADANNKAAEAAGKQALKSILKARASLEAFTAAQGEAAAELEVAVADEAKMAADLNAAAAAGIKARSSQAAAEAAREEAAAARFSIGPIGLAAAALVAFGVSAYFAFNHFKKLRLEHENFNDLLNVGKVKFTEQMDAMKKAAEGAQEYHDWLKKLGDRQESLSEKTEESLKALREESRLRRERASERGADKNKLRKMEIQDLEKERELVIQNASIARKKFVQDKQQTDVAAALVNNPNQIAKSKNAKDLSKTAEEIYNEIEKSLRDPGFFAALRQKFKSGNISDAKIDVEVGGKKYQMSLNQARKSVEVLAASEAQLAANQKALSDLYARKKTMTEKDLKDKDKLEKEQRDIESKISLLQKYPDKGKGKVPTGHLTNLQSVGAFISPGQVALIDVNKRIERNTAIIAQHIQNRSRVDAGRNNKPAYAEVMF